MRKMMAIAALLAVSTSFPVNAEPTVLKFAAWGPPGANINNVIDEWSKSVTRDSGGKLKVVVYYNTLANPRTVYDTVKNGIADVGWGLQPLVRGKFPRTSVVGLPFLFDSATQGSAALWSIYEKGAISAEYDEIRALGLAALPQVVIHTRKSIRNIGELKGMKMRVVGRTYAEVARTLGAVGVQLPITAVYEALKKGVVDASLSPWLGFRAFNLQEASKTHINVQLGSIPGMMFMNKASWNRLPKMAKAAINKHSYLTLSRRLGEITDRDANENLAFTRSLPGHNVLEIKAAELDNLKESLKPVESSWVKRIPDGANVIAAMREAVQRVK